MSHIVKAIPETTDQLVELETFLEVAQIPYHISPMKTVHPYSPSRHPFLHIAKPTTKFRPTADYKLFAGSEYLSPKGLVGYEDVLERIYTYATINNLLTVSGFQLDDTLHQVLKTQTHRIDWEELYQHLEVLFTRV